MQKYVSQAKKHYCSHCHKRKAYKMDENSQPVCRSCAGYQQPKRKCDSCGRIRIVKIRIKTEDNQKGRPVCSECYEKYFRKKEYCCFCGLLKKVETRDDQGCAICKNCYQTPKEKCSLCSQFLSVHIRDTQGSPICSRCYTPQKEKCVICQTIKKVYTRTEKTKKPICRECAAQPLAKCYKCSLVKSVHQQTEKGPVCFECYIPPNKECSCCGEIRPLAVTIPPICRVCYQEEYKVNGSFGIKPRN